VPHFTQNEVLRALQFKGTPEIAIRFPQPHRAAAKFLCIAPLWE
jgi:hypothetical protein